MALLVLAFAPGIFWLWMVRRRDRYRPEPRALVIRTFLWGMIVAIPVAIVEALLLFLASPGSFGPGATAPPSIGTIAFVSFVVAGVTEELGKFLVVRHTVYHSPYFDEPMDGLVYSSAAALGFASLENVGYLLAFGWQAILVRGPFSTLAHVLFSVMWGYPLAQRKVRGHGLKGRLLLGLIASMVAHGLFDFLLFREDTYSLLVIPLFLAGGGLLLLMLRHAARVSPYRSKVGRLLVTCPRCGGQVPYYASYCTSCGTGLAEAKERGSLSCSQCGAALNAEAEFCTACGSRLSRRP